MKIEQTGRFPHEETGVYTLYVSETDEDIKYLIEIQSHNRPEDELHLVRRNDTVEFLRVSSTEYEDEVEENGLNYIDTSFIGDLGIGIYAVDYSSTTAINNLKSYAMTLQDMELLVITGSYTGEYYECITEGDHEGYLVFKEPLSRDCINEISKVDTVDFSYEY